MFSQSLFSLLTCLGLLVLLTAADGDENNYFINPPWVPGPLETFENNNVYGLGSTLNLNWETNFSTISLILWQRENASYIYLINRQPVSKSLLWDIDLDGQYNITSAELETPNVFSLELWEMIDNNDQVGGRFSCHYFNITGDQSNPAAAHQTTSTSSSTASTATDSQIASATSDETSLTAAPTASPSSGLSADAKIAIGVSAGVGAACLLLGAIIALIFWRKSRKALRGHDEDQRPGDQSSVVEPKVAPAPNTFDASLPKPELSPNAQLEELSGEMATHELSSEQSQELPGHR